MNLKNHSKLFLSFCVALALSGGEDWYQLKRSLLKLKVLG